MSAIYWQHAGNLLTTCQPHAGYMLVTCWQHAGNMHSTFWQHAHIMIRTIEHTDYIPAISKPVELCKICIHIISGYTLCFLPTTLVMVIDPMPPKRNYPGLHVGTYIIFWCSGFINPIIYIMTNKYYR